MKYATIFLVAFLLTGCEAYQTIQEAIAQREQIDRLEQQLQDATVENRHSLMNQIEALRRAREEKLDELSQKLEEYADTAETVTGAGANLTQIAGSFGIPGLAGVGMALAAANNFLRRRRTN